MEKGSDGTLLVLCDGLGGHRAGGRAAAHGVSGLLERQRQGTLEDLPAAALEISAELILLGQSEPACEGLGTTLLALWIQGHHVSYAAAGDTRLYHYHDGVLDLVVEPQELGTILLREGVLKPDEVEMSPLRGRLTSYLGHWKPEIATGELLLGPGERLALLTDGVLEGGTERIECILGRAELTDAARELACGVPTDDNATAIVAALETP